MMFWYQSERGSHILADLICLMVPSGEIWFEFVIWLGLNSRLVALECLRQIRALFYNMCSLKLWSWEAFHDQTSLWSCVFGYCFILYSFKYTLLEFIIHRMYEKALRRGMVKEIISTLFKFTLLKLSLPDFFFFNFCIHICFMKYNWGMPGMEIPTGSEASLASSMILEYSWSETGSAWNAEDWVPYIQHMPESLNSDILGGVGLGEWKEWRVPTKLRRYLETEEQGRQLHIMDGSVYYRVTSLTGQDWMDNNLEEMQLPSTLPRGHWDNLELT